MARGIDSQFTRLYQIDPSAYEGPSAWEGLADLVSVINQSTAQQEEKKRYQTKIEYQTKRDEIEDQQKKEGDRIQEEHYKGVRGIQRQQATTAQEQLDLNKRKSQLDQIESFVKDMPTRQRIEFLRKNKMYLDLVSDKGTTKEDLDQQLHEMDLFDDKLDAVRSIPFSRDIDKVDSAMRVLSDRLDDTRAANLYDRLALQKSELMEEQREKQEVTQAELVDAFGVGYAQSMTNLVNEHFTKGSLSEEEMEKLIETGGLSAAKEKILAPEQLAKFQEAERKLRTMYEGKYKELKGIPGELDFGISDEEFEKFTQLETENPALLDKWFEQEGYSFGDLMEEGFPTKSPTKEVEPYGWALTKQTPQEPEPTQTPQPEKLAKGEWSPTSFGSTKIDQTVMGSVVSLTDKKGVEIAAIPWSQFKKVIANKPYAKNRLKQLIGSGKGLYGDVKLSDDQIDELVDLYDKAFSKSPAPTKSK